MHKKSSIVCILIALVIEHLLVVISVSGVPCIQIVDQPGYFVFFASKKTCKIDTSAAIDSADFTISSDYDDDVDGIEYSSNKKIQYLPVNPATIFPDLVIIAASGCSIKSISRLNFEGLRKLRALYLESNRIERVNSDTFKDLDELEQIFLSERRFNIMKLY